VARSLLVVSSICTAILAQKKGIEVANVVPYYWSPNLPASIIFMSINIVKGLVSVAGMKQCFFLRPCLALHGSSILLSIQMRSAFITTRPELLTNTSEAEALKHWKYVPHLRSHTSKHWKDLHEMSKSRPHSSSRRRRHLVPDTNPAQLMMRKSSGDYGIEIYRDRLKLNR
jgi:hypothetical protein